MGTARPVSSDVRRKKSKMAYIGQILVGPPEWAQPFADSPDGPSSADKPIDIDHLTASTLADLWCILIDDLSESSFRKAMNDITKEYCEKGGESWRCFVVLLPFELTKRLANISLCERHIIIQAWQYKCRWKENPPSESSLLRSLNAICLYASKAIDTKQCLLMRVSENDRRTSR